MSFENIRLEKGMYREGGRSFSQVLESLDPSEHYKGTALEGTDAFQRQLKRFDIRARGPGSDNVEKFFQTFESAVLFPEFIARVVRQGMEENDILPGIVATVTDIDSMDYRSIYSDATDRDKELADVAEGASIPATTIRSRENLITLSKRGRMLVASYEALRFQKLDLFSVMLRQIGSHIQRMHMDDVMALIRADADTFELDSTEIGGTADSLDYDALVNFWAQFYPYEMNTMLASTGSMTKLLKLPELQNPLTGLNFQGTGKFATPLGAQMLLSSAVGDDMIVGLDHRYAIEMVKAGDVNVEYDKLIDRQLERAAITSICGFGTIMDGAVKCLKVK